MARQVHGRIFIFENGHGHGVFPAVFLFLKMYRVYLLYVSRFYF